MNFIDDAVLIVILSVTNIFDIFSDTLSWLASPS